MAKYEITYSCGHTGVENLGGTNDERERKLQWYQSTAVCPECWEEQRKKASEEKLYKAKLDAATTRDALSKEGIKLPDLVGSDKQISWAKDILTNLIADDKISWAIKKVIELNPNLSKTAKYWIDRRDRYELDWCRIAMSKCWGMHWTKEYPQVQAAAKILYNHKAMHGKTAEQVILQLSQMAQIPVPDEKPKFLKKYDREEIDHWFVSQWARNGLVEWLRAHLENINPVDAAEAARKSDEARESLKAAVKLQAEADQIKMEAKEMVWESMDNLAMILGTKGYYLGDEYELVGILDSGAKVIVRDAKEYDIQLTRKEWFIAAASYRCEHPADH